MGSTLTLFALMTGAVIMFGVGAMVGAVLMHDSMEDRDQEEGPDDLDEW